MCQYNLLLTYGDTKGRCEFLRKVNLDVRIKIMEAGLNLYQIAERLNIPETAFSRKLRKELSTSEKHRILKVINEMLEEV